MVAHQGVVLPTDQGSTEWISISITYINANQILLEKRTNLGSRGFVQNKGSALCIQDYQYKGSINLNQK